jgi:hypothetical protein
MCVKLGVSLFVDDEKIDGGNRAAEFGPKNRSNREWRTLSNKTFYNFYYRSVTRQSLRELASLC